jgi:hypothetical protein
MPDLICPPLTLSPAEPWCPCRPVRIGVGLLTTCVYSAAYAPVFFGKPLAAVVGHVLHGDIPLVEQPFIWAGAAAYGALMLGGGVRRIRNEGHGLKPGSLLWSAGVIAAVSWLLAHYIGPGLTDSALVDHVVRMLLLAWAASNAANIVLQLGEVLGWRRFARRERAASQPVAQPSGFLRGRRVTVATIEDIEGGQEAENLARHLGANPADVLRALGHGGDVPLIDLVPDENGDLIPQRLPADRVKVTRRRR